MKAYRIVFLNVLLGALLLGHSSAQAASIIGYWAFDGNGTDQSPSGNDLVISGGTGFGSGLFSQALSLDGSTSHFASRTPNDDAIYDFGLSDFTVQGWVNYNTTSGEQVLIEKWVGAGGPGWTLTKLGTNAYRFHGTSGFAIDTAPLTVDTGVWHQLIVRRSGSSFSLFFDGTEAATGTFAGAVENTAMPLLIGKRNDDDGRGFALNGLVDEVAIWDGALSNAEIDFLWNAGAGRQADSISAVPEPSSLILLSMGALGLVGYGRRQRRQATRIIPAPGPARPEGWTR